jgi:hypothetical protein
MKKWKTDELAFILYNNRSVEGVVQNFVPSDLNWDLLDDIESKIEWVQNIYQEDRMVEVEKSQIDMNAPDVLVKPLDLSNLTDLVLDAHKNISDLERNWLNARGIDNSMIDTYKLGGMSYITDHRALEILNCTVHPLLAPILSDGLEGGGILIPLFENNKLVNCAIRKLSDIGKLKYGLACPDLSVWNINNLKSHEIFICEGLFDMMALIKQGKEAISVSSAMWSGPQLLKVIEYYPKSITIWADDDQAGLRCAKVLQRFFAMYGIACKTVKSKVAKDAAEHFIEKGLTWDNVEEIKITREMIAGKEDMSFNFLKYLNERKF